MTADLPAQVQYVPFTQFDKEVVAATLIGEAGGEQTRGMQAVVNVVMNRAGKDPSRARQVCLSPMIFSFWNGKEITEGIAQAKQHPCWAKAMMLTTQALEGHLPDITRGASHFYNPKRVNPPWAKSMRPTAVIGAHRFLKD